MHRRISAALFHAQRLEFLRNREYCGLSIDLDKSAHFSHRATRLNAQGNHSLEIDLSTCRSPVSKCRDWQSES